MGILFLLLLAGACAEDPVSSRLVVTFRSVKENSVTGVDLGGAKVVKQYGRRLVLDLKTPFDLAVQTETFKGRFAGVQNVEVDHLVSADQDFIVSDSLVVANASDPNVDGAVISPASQTPLWNLMDSEPYSIHAEGVWQVTNSTPDVVVAVLDTGMAEPARGMFLNLLDGYDFISDDGISIDWDGRDPDATDPGDWGDMCPTPSWHGTKVASILAARHDNEFGMKGVAQNCSVLPIRVLGLCRMGYATDVTDAIVWAAGGAINGVPTNPKPAKIISLSLAGQGACPDYMQSAINQAVNLSAVVITAAGNNNKNVSGYFPANCKGVIPVASSTREGKLAGYSNWGDLIAVSAPGGDSVNAIATLSVNVLETDLELAYGIGTSFSVPHVAAVAALYSSFLFNSNSPDFALHPDIIIKHFASNGNCPQSLCGKGILSVNGINQEKSPSNSSFIESHASWNSSGMVFGVDIVIPPGNTAGNVLDINGNPSAWSKDPALTVTEGIGISVQCGAGQFICFFQVYRDGTSTRGVLYDCCNMHGQVVFSSQCRGFCMDYTTWESWHGWFSSIALTSNRYHVAGAFGSVTWGGAISADVITDSKCPVGYYVNGVYMDASATIFWNRVLCRPLFINCPAGFFSSGPNTNAGGGAVVCPPGTFSNRGSIACIAPRAPRTTYLLPGISETCKWMYYFNRGCTCWGSLGVIWNENNGPNPLTSGLPAVCSSCDLSERVGACNIKSHVGVSTSSWGWSGIQSQTCSQCYQSISSVSTIPSNCASTASPTVQQCYNFNACSGCGCFRNQWGGTAMCHSCNAGYFSSPPSFTTCTACPVGSFSATVGLLNAEEADVNTISYSFSSVNLSPGCNLPMLDSAGAWCSNVINDGWLQIDLGRTRVVRGFVTQGRASVEQWVTGYTITSSTNGAAWSSFENNVYEGNSDSNTRQVNFIYTNGVFSSISARYIRLSLSSGTSFNGHFSLRWNVLVVPITSDNSALDHLAPCTPCASGKYSASVGSSMCTSCPKGKFSTAIGAVSEATCQSCAAGKFSAETGSVFAPMKWSASSAWSPNTGAWGGGVGSFTPTNCRYWQMYGNQPSYICAYNEGYYVWWSGTRWLGSYFLRDYGGTPWHLGPSLPSYDATDVIGPVMSALLPSATSVEMCIAWTVCPAGMYQTAAPTASADRVCAACIAGYYCLGGDNGLSPLTAACSPGNQETISPTASVNRVCATCTAGYYCDGSTTKVVCPAGFYCPNPSTKTACTSTGSFCPPGSISQALCELGSYCTNSSTKTTCTLTGSYCPAGSTSQALCDLGSYCPNPSNKTTCTSTGSYCQTGSTQSSLCPEGYYCPDSRTKTLCPKNAYCPSGVTTPTLCPKGSLGNAAGTSSSANCVACVAGKYSPVDGASVCSDCTAGSTYSTAAGATSCSPCSPINTCPAADDYIKTCTVTSDTTCASCSGQTKPGNSFWIRNLANCTWACSITPPYYKSGSACSACLLPSGCSTGQYATLCSTDTDGTCTPCNNKAASNSKYTDKSPDYASSCPWVCNSGYIMSGGDCVQCNAGYYSLEGNSSCSTCSAGTFSASGASACSDCEAGKYSLNIAGACSSCDPGKYSAVAKAVSSATCTNCGAGKYSTAPASTGCTNCDAGTSSAAPSANTAGTCVGCTAGSYSSAGAASCTPCNAGYYSAALSATANSTCQGCATGYYSSAGSSTCTACGYGTYSTTALATVSTVCQPCNSTSYTPTNGATTCTLCPACTNWGTYRANCAGASVGTCMSCSNPSVS